MSKNNPHNSNYTSQSTKLIMAGMPTRLFMRRAKYSIRSQICILEREVSEARSDGVKKNRLKQYLVDYYRKSAPEVQRAINAHFSDFVGTMQKNKLEI